MIEFHLKHGDAGNNLPLNAKRNLLKYLFLLFIKLLII